jgi:preprotein translocase subunit SecE
MRIKTYLQDSYNELIHKVSWPTTAELQNSAIVVMIASFIIAMIIFGMDTVFENLMETIYSILY